MVCCYTLRKNVYKGSKSELRGAQSYVQN